MLYGKKTQSPKKQPPTQPNTKQQYPHTSKTRQSKANQTKPWLDEYLLTGTILFWEMNIFYCWAGLLIISDQNRRTLERGYPVAVQSHQQLC